MRKSLLIALSLLAFLNSQTQTITTIAGNGTPGYTGDGFSATTAQVNYPKSVAYDATGNVYISDTWNNVIRKVTPTGIISTIAGNGVQGNSGNGGPALLAQLYRPYGIVVSPLGEVYFSDTYNNCVKKISPTGTITLVAGNSIQGYGGDGGLAVNAMLYRPFGLALDAGGNVIISDCFNHAIRKVDISTGTITTIAGTGIGGFSGDGTAATGAQLNGPSAVAFDPSGNLYIADYTNNRIRKINTSGIISTFAGNGAGTFGGDGGLATAASLWIPTGLGTDGVGNVYIADHNNSRIRMVNTSGIITTVAGNGSSTFSGDGGPPVLAGMTSPEEIAVDPIGNIYIAESAGYRIRKVIVSTSGINNLINPVLDVNIYPNPSAGIFNIGSEELDATAIKIYNSIGQLVFEEKKYEKQKHTLDLFSLTAGIYFVSLENEDKILLRKKIIKQ